MATNAIGLNLLLQASNTQLQDLLKGLQPGDVLKGRIVDLLPQGKAIINLQGQNLLAQLPAPVSGQSFQKGDVLPLEVTQAAGTKASAGTSSTPENAVTLRILPSQSNSPAQSANTASPSMPSGAFDPMPGLSSRSLPPVAVMEQALSAARMPATPANLAVVRTLAAHGLPLDAQTLQSVIQQAESLLAAEQAPLSLGSGPASTPTLPAPVQVVLRQNLPALRLSVQTTPNAATRIGSQRALSIVEEALAPQPTIPNDAALTAPVPAPVEPSLPAPPSLSTAATPSSLNNPSGAAPAPNPDPALQVSQALQAVLKDPSPQNLQALQDAISQAALPVVASSVVAPPTSPNINASLRPTAARSETSSSTDAPIALPVRRETMVLLVRALPPDQPLLPKQIVQNALSLRQALEDPQSPAAKDLIQAVQTQFPEAQPTQVLEQAKQALDQAIVHFETLPPTRELPGPQALSAELEAATLPAPRQPLSQFPREIVFEAVAWLKARDLPPQRPLVEAAAQFLSRGQAALDLADKVVQTKTQLPEGFLEWRPALKQAFVHLERAIQSSTLKLDRADLAEQLSQWPQASGLTLEKSLLADLPLSPENEASAPLTQRAPSLKEALAEVQHELKAALRDPAGAAPTVAPVLERAAAHANEALQGLSALPLQAQPGPTVQSITLPLALPLNGPLSNGQITVSWRKGQDRQLDDKDPVNVAVALQTESLGEVRVLMQVWKGAANVSVKAADQGTADFLQSGSAELKAGFAERTPFKLQNLGFDVATGLEAQEAPGSVVPTSPGLNLSA